MSPRQLVIAVLLVPLLLLAGSVAVFAHAGLISADPPAGSVVATAPSLMTLTFTEPVLPTALSLIGVGGTPQALSFTQPDGPLVEIALPTGLADGSYLLSWRVTSADGHPVNGTIEFAIGAPSGTLAAPAANDANYVAIWFVRAAQYVALLFGVGSLATAALVSLPARLLRPARRVALAGLVLVPVAIALHGLDLIGAAPPALASTEPWAAAAASAYILTQAAFALAFVIALLPGRWSPPVAAALAIVGVTLSGHVVTAPPQGVMRVALAVHIASLVVWVGALLPLLWSMGRGDARLLLRFSRYAPFAIVGLIGSGLAMALVQLGPFGVGWLNPYGVLLWAKLALVAVLLLIGLWNRLRLTGLALAGHTRPLQRSIVVELGLIVAVLCVVAGWRFTPPPRVIAEIEVPSAPAYATLRGSDGAVRLSAAPGRAGPVLLSMELPEVAQSVTLRLANPGLGIATISRAAQRAADGQWTAAAILPSGGVWQVEVEARVSDFDLRSFAGTLTLPVNGKDNTMKLPPLAAAVASSMLAATPVLAAPGILASCPVGQSFAASGITVSGAWLRATPKGAQSAGAYLNVANGGSAADTFLGATSEAASDISLHSMTMDGNVMKMAPVEGGLEVPAGGSIALSPMGFHLMLTGMEQPFVEGQCVEMTLHFAVAGDLKIDLNIGSLIDDGPPAGDGADTTSSMPMDHDTGDMSSMAM